MKNISSKQVSTLFLKAVLVVMAIAVLAFCVFSFMPMLSAALKELPEMTGVIYVAFIGVYATALPFFFGLYQAFILLQNIDVNNAFSHASANALWRIKYCAIAMSILYATGMPLAFVIAELDDAPGLILMYAAVVGAPLVVAVFAAVLQKLIESAVAIKTENDLTV